MLWSKAVTALTTSRSKSRVLGEDYVRNLWDYCFDEYLLKYGVVKSAERMFLEDWVDFADDSYGTRTPQNLKVAYFSGPEPENDLQVLIDLGIRIENVWAFESEEKVYSAAIEKAQIAYPTLKIFPGTIDNFLEFSPTQFDIIYLDFTAPLFSRKGKPFATVHSVFDSQALSELGVLITNYSEPDSVEETTTFLANYFFSQEFVEGTVFGLTTPEGNAVNWFVESAETFGWDHQQQLERVIAANYQAAYSAFCTQYPMMYANLIQPTLRVMQNRQAKRRIFATDDILLQTASKRVQDLSFLSNNSQDVDQDLWGPGGDFYLNHGHFPIWFFLELLSDSDSKLSKTWIGYFKSEHKGVSRLEAAKFSDLLRNAGEGYWPILSEPLRKAIPQITQALPDQIGGANGPHLFCDIPMPHLWLEVAVNQLGFPYHPNVDAHWRSQYRAKERKMVLDLFVFDKCRALYDWLPTIELYGRDLATIERQILARICLNAIGRQRRWIVPQLYFATALIGYNERDWAREPDLIPRVDLSTDSSG